MKTKIAAAVGFLAIGATLFATFAGAQTAALSVACSGSVSTNVITWTATPAGGAGSNAFVWTGANLSGTSSVVTATYNATGTFQAAVQVTDASSTVATTTCQATVLSLPIVPTPTPPPAPVPVVNRPQLHIDGNGHFLARGMKVTSVASGTIQAQVWGITYTINLATGGQFLRRDGKGLFATLSQQINVGDEVSASGVIDPASPFVVNAGVVRDFSIVTQRQNHDGDNDNENEGHGNGKTVVSGTSTFTLPGTTTTVTIDAQTRLKDLLKQLQNLQGIFNSQKGKGNDGHGDN